MEKKDFFLIAESMLPNEIHPKVIEVLDRIANLLPAGEDQDVR